MASIVHLQREREFIIYRERMTSRRALFTYRERGRVYYLYREDEHQAGIVHLQREREFVIYRERMTTGRA